MSSFEEKIVENGKKIRNSLSLRTYPLGVKFCKHKEEAEKMMIHARRPLKNFNLRMAVCQVVNMSRTYGWTLGMSEEDGWCIAGSLAMGLLSELPEYLPGEMSKWHAKDENAGKAIWEIVEKKLLPLKSVYAVLVAPLERIRFEPDVVVVYGTPTQVARIAKAFTWHGISAEMKFAGMIACSTISNAYLTGKPQVSIPCAGEVILGRSEEDEISISFPANNMEELLSGLDGTKFMFPYPPAKFSLYEPRAPKDYKITYNDYIEWKKQKGK
ncbi:MAG: DUF169 domain-containing protein [Candidatus Bathyarchaeota archaeon]|nr:DUF169 domain-containing protein [Candidatus Bathyarchaeota archaeon]